VVTPPGRKAGEFIGSLHPHTWDLSSVPCLYIGKSQRGTLGEFEDANDPIIEGYYTQYMVADLFDTHPV